MPPDEQLQLLAASLARARGEEFFPVLAAHLGATLGAREALICEIASARRARTLAVWRDGALAENFDYELAGTPCARVYAGDRVILPTDPATFPGAPRDRAAYVGLPLSSTDGAVLGHACAWFDRPVSLSEEQRTVCEILANRAAAELRLVHVKRERALLRAQRRQLRAEISATHDVQDLVGTSSAHQHLVAEIGRLAAGEGPVLLSGEPGTGKELVARAIHAAGARASKPFTRLDCTQPLIGDEISALPQIIGFTRGGTLFLDEIGGLSLPMQERLQDTLRRMFSDWRSNGGAMVRVLASTRHNLRTAHIGVLPELLSELGAFALELPPLRTRIEDIPALVQRFAQKQARRLGRSIENVDPDSLAALMRHSWPGNLRELAGVVERAAVTQQGATLKIATDLVISSPAERAALIAAAAVDPTTATTSRQALVGAVDFDDTLNTGLHAVQREHILRVLNATRWVIEGNSGAALRLGLKPATLRHRMKKLGISRAQSPLAT